MVLLTSSYGAGISLNPVIYPEQGAPYYLNVALGEVLEVSPLGTTVKPLNLAALPWYIQTTTQVASIPFCVSLSNSVHILLPL